jgi:putative aldouronate transport system substrate-binding protein
MIKKAILCAVILLCTTAFVFAGGGGEETTNYVLKPEISAANSPITISIYHETGGQPQPAANHPMYQYIKDKLNVSFTWDILVGDAKTKQGVMIAGGQYPDMVELRGNDFIEAGALIPLEGYIDKYAPRVKALYKDVWNKMKSADGHTYYLINYGVFTGADQNPNYDQPAFWIQKAVLKDAGYPKIKTVDEYFNLIENYYKKNPTIDGQPSIPFVILTHDWRAFELWNPPNFLAGNPNDGDGTINPRNYEYKLFWTQEISKRWFKKLNELDKKGLIDRASFTDTYDQYSAKISSGRVLGQSVQGWQFMYGPDLANRDRGQNIRTMAPLPIVWDSKTTPHYRTWVAPNILRGGGITVSAKDPVRIVRFINDLLAEDVQRTLNWGIEGKDWQWDAQKKPYRTAQQRANWNNDNWQTQNLARLMRDVFPKLEGSFSDGFPSDLSNYFPEREAMILPEDKELWAAYGVTSNNELMDKNPPPNPPWFPAWSANEAAGGSPSKIAQERGEQIMKQRLPQIILAPTADFERLWADYVKEMNAAIGPYETYMQEQLNKRLKDWGIRK